MNNAHRIKWRMDAYYDGSHEIRVFATYETIAWFDHYPSPLEVDSAITRFVDLKKDDRPLTWSGRGWRRES